MYILYIYHTSHILTSMVRYQRVKLKWL